jgi:hypothetical protein
VAFVTPVVLLILLSGFFLLSSMMTKLVCVDGAGAAVRAAARGEPIPQMRPGVQTTVTYEGDLVRVTVRKKVSNPVFGGLYVEDTAVALVEPQSASGP